MLTLIGIPTANTVEPETLKAIYGQADADTDTSLDILYGFRIDVQRNLLCEEAIRIGADYLLMVDSDVVLPSTALRDLLDPPAEIVSGLVRIKSLRRKGEYAAVFKGIPLLYESIPEGRSKVDWCGGACLMIKTSILKDIPKPWFEFHEEPGAAVSEDIWFCQQAQKAGIQVYADKRVACGHIIKEQYGFEEGF